MQKLMLTLVLVAATLSGSAAALANPMLVTNSYPLAGERSELAFDGGSTLVGGYENDTTNVVRAFTPALKPKVIARVVIKPESEEFGDSMFFVASTSRLLLLDRGRSFGYKGSNEIRYEHLLTGKLVGPLRELPDECRITPTLDPTVGPADILPHTAISLDGDLEGYDTYGCLVVIDFATGQKRVIPLEATLDPVKNEYLQLLTDATTLRIAGRLVAYRRNPAGGEGPADVVVYDFDTGEVLYQVALPQGEPTFDLQSDGTLVIADPASCTATVSTIANPSPRPLGVPACMVQRVLDGRALMVVPTEDGKDLQLAWTSLQTPALHTVEDLGNHSVLESAPGEMNETEVAYARVGCGAQRIYRTSLAEPGVPPAVPKTCPIDVSPRSAELVSKKLRIRVRCPLGCSGTVDAQAGTAKQLRTGVGAKTLDGELPRISIAPGGSTSLALLPSDGDETSPTVVGLTRRLKRKQKLYLRLDFEIYTPIAESRMTDEEAIELGFATHTSPHIVVPIRLHASSAGHASHQ